MYANFNVVLQCTGSHSHYTHKGVSVNISATGRR